MMLPDNYLEIAIDAAIEAGKATLEFYSKDIEVDIKADDSPLTQADLKANRLIENKLQSTGVPVLSEESVPPQYAERAGWKCLWIVDPLDGTKEFIKKSDEYTVNIAYVENNTPVMGVVYAPAMDVLYYGDINAGAFKVIEASKAGVQNILSGKAGVRISGKTSNSEEVIIVASKSHRNPETNEIIAKLAELFESVKTESFGSSLKLCMVAEGVAQIYPRIGPTMEWDTAASHAVVTASGAKIFRYPSLDDMKYNKEDLLNPYFIVVSEEFELQVVDSLK